MRLFINTELDAKNSLVTSQADNNQKVLPDLFLGDAIPLVISFTDNQGGFAHWQDEENLSVKVAIGVLATNSLYAYQDQFEYHDNQFFGTLVLHTESLANALSGADSLNAVFEVQVKRGNGQSITTHQSSVSIQNQLISFESVAPVIIGTDSDFDGVPDIYDAFPNDGNSTSDYDYDGSPDNTDDDLDNPLIQTDTDNDGVDDSIDSDFIDTDGDGVVDSQDDAPLDPNVTVDTDGDGIDDTVDPDFVDSDGDGVVDSQDDAPNDPNVIVDTDGDGIDDSVDPDFVDTDGDGVVDSQDAFPNDASESVDSDSDGVGDNSDDAPNDPNVTVDADGDGIDDSVDPDFVDSDGDGVVDSQDAFPNDASESVDSDGDGVGDNSDGAPNDPNVTVDADGDGIDDSVDPDFIDSDGDGVVDSQDDAPSNPDIQTDADGDGVDDSVDPDFVDTDGDGVVDAQDAFPNDATEWTDNDGDGVGNNADAFPNDPNETTDSDGDGIGDNSDPDFVDSDGDGVVDSQDAFPNDATETVDSDSDGVGDNSDAFPNDSTESADSDGDGVGDNTDAFPNDATETVDSDSDGVGDNSDAFPNDSTESADSDGDGVGDNTDAFPNDASETVDSDGDGVGDNADQYPNDPDRQFIWAEDNEFVYPDHFNDSIGAHKIILLQPYTNTRMGYPISYEAGTIWQTTGGGVDLVRAEDPNNPRITPYDTTNENQSSGAWKWWNISERGITWNFAKLTSQKYYVYGDDGVNGNGYYYPVYTENIGLVSAHTHVIDGITYYMDSTNMNHAQPSAPTDADILESPYQAYAVYGIITDYKYNRYGRDLPQSWHYPVFINNPPIDTDTGTLFNGVDNQTIYIKKYEEVTIDERINYINIPDSFYNSIETATTDTLIGNIIVDWNISTLNGYAVKNGRYTADGGTNYQSWQGKMPYRYNYNTSSNYTESFIPQQVNDEVLGYYFVMNYYRSGILHLENAMRCELLNDFRPKMGENTPSNRLQYNNTSNFTKFYPSDSGRSIKGIGNYGTGGVYSGTTYYISSISEDGSQAFLTNGGYVYFTQKDSVWQWNGI